MLNSFLLAKRNGPRICALAALASAVLGGCAAGRRAPLAADLGPYRPLAPFFEALANKGASFGPGGRVAVLQIGDSHTANDAFSGHMRELMQARFGDGGRGLLPPGIPYAYYRPARVHVTAAGWQVVRSTEPGAFGLAGLRQHASGPAVMTIEADPGDLAQTEVMALPQPGGGTLDIVADDGRRASVSTRGPGPQPIKMMLPGSGAARSVQVSAQGDGPVDVLSWSVRRAAGGVTWSNLGTIGATIEIVGRWDPRLMHSEGGTLAPALVIVAFGTNEGFKDSQDMLAYPGLVRDALRALRAAAPGAAMMVLGPPGGVRPVGAGAGTACGGTGYAVPVNLPTVRKVLRQVAAEQGAYFWDWAAAMGGDCSMVAWSAEGLAARDHVHLLKPGYQQTADALFGELMNGYGRFIAAR
jgi:lysophospholipase L1-like esterase